MTRTSDPLSAAILKRLFLQSELAPMGAVTLVASQLFSRYMLKEIFTKTDLYATILMSGL